MTIDAEVVRKINESFERDFNNKKLKFELEVDGEDLYFYFKEKNKKKYKKYYSFNIKSSEIHNF